MASAGEILLHSTTAPSPGEDEVGRVVECTSISGPGVELTETPLVELEVRLELDASVLMVPSPPVGDSLTELLEFST